MASMFKKFNKKQIFSFDTTGFEYCSLKDLYEKNGESYQYVVRAIYCNHNSIYSEDDYVIATDNEFINVPVHRNSDMAAILADPACISEINNGNARFVIYTYFKKKYNKVCYDIEFC